MWLNVWQSSMCSTKYITVASLSNKIHLSEQTVSNRIHQWTVACVQQIHHSCHWVQQNTLAIANVFNKTYDSCQCVQQNMTVASVFNKLHLTAKTVSNRIHLTVNSRQCPTKYVAVAAVSNKIYLRQWTVSKCHRPWQTRCKVLCQPTSLTDGHGFYDYVLMSPLPGTVAAAVNF
jgi:hypothetical protein